MEGYEELPAPDKMSECVLLGLRMNQGVELKALEHRFGCVLRKDQQEKIQDFVREGFLETERGILKTTANGRMVLDEICARLI